MLCGILTIFFVRFKKIYESPVEKRRAFSRTTEFYATREKACLFSTRYGFNSTD